MRLTLVLSFFLLVSGVAHAQEMYIDDLRQSTGVVRALMVRAERISPTDQQGALAIGKEAFDVQKRLSQISEEAGFANLELMRSGNKPDRHLILVVSTAEALRLANDLTLGFLDTRDEVFWTTALSVASTAGALQESMK